MAWADALSQEAVASRVCSTLAHQLTLSSQDHHSVAGSMPTLRLGTHHLTFSFVKIPTASHGLETHFLPPTSH